MFGRLLLLSWMIVENLLGRFHLHNTDLFDNDFTDQIQYDCIHYYVRTFNHMYGHSNQVVHQTIAYCLRPWPSTDDFRLSAVENNSKQVSFKELRVFGVTSQQLYSEWFAPVDVAEQYQFFLDNILILSDQYFYNCSSPWFGDRCQYAFAYANSSSTFADIVRDTFLAKESPGDEPLLVTNLTCYIHLQCDRGPPPSCLDWREVCDGKIDCLNGGVDENNCFHLELNNCDGYRCQIGHCIPEDFAHDDFLNPDCPDGTEEPVSQSYPKFCFKDPAFRCEERTVRRSLQNTCGDGESLEPQSIVSAHACFNWRYMLLTRTFLSERACNVSYECWLFMTCIHPLRSVFHSLQCNDICSSTADCHELFVEICPTVFFYPAGPIAFGHVRFAYNLDSSTLSRWRYVPDYVCFDEILCEGSLVPTSRIEGRACLELAEVGIRDPRIDWGKLMRHILDIFGTCSSSYSSIRRYNDSHCQNSNFYPCANSSKCVSEHRLVDGFKDCLQADDEFFQRSCSLPNGQHRYRCTLPQNKCISPVQIGDVHKDCEYGAEDFDPIQIEFQKQPSFFKLCDGVLDVKAMLLVIGGESDETQCEHWPCNNIYTRCDGFWNCQNGADESECPNSICPARSHPCLSSFTNKLTCLPVENVNDGRVDCRGATDERQHCREQHSTEWKKYRCWNDTTCINPDDLCTTRIHDNVCKYEDHQQFCSFLSDIPKYFCPYYEKRDSKPTIEQLILCNLIEQHPTENGLDLYFSLGFSNNYPRLSTDPKTTNTTKYIYSDSTTNTASDSTSDTRLAIPFAVAWICNRGIAVQMSNKTACLCPPSYYGSTCEYQNERVSLTLQFRKESVLAWHIVLAIVMTLIDDKEHRIESFDQIVYVPSRDCSAKFNIYLLYSNRPKVKPDMSKNFSVRIDAYNKRDLSFYAAWHLEIPFQFLPVNRISIQLTIPMQAAPKFVSPTDCLHGRRVKIENTDKTHWCVCNQGWRGRRCDIEQKCDCSVQSRCVGRTNDNRSICICPVGKFAHRCFLTHSSCTPDTCKHGGICVPPDEHISESNFTCLCAEGYSGLRCEYTSGKIEISFRDGLPVPVSILAHFITVFNKSAPHTRTTVFKRSAVYQDIISLTTTSMFHIVFTEIDSVYYLTVLQEQFTPSDIIRTSIGPSRHCPHVREFLNSTIMNYHIIRRAKYYHLLCREELPCFHDEIYMCLCTTEHHANCLEFDHNMTYRCRSVKRYCEHDKARCFQDHPSCPKSFLCVCPDCTYGVKCQFSTSGLGLSLDAIIGYQIRPHVSFNQQVKVVKVSAALTMTIFVVGLLNAILSILTFKSKLVLEVGCGIYLMGSSVTSLLTMVVFGLKFWVLLLSQMAYITNRIFLLYSCVMTDFLLKILLNTGDWLNACIAIERAITISKGALFNKVRSKRTAKWITLLLCLIIITTNIYDPIHRRLVDDGEEDQRIWCVNSYPDNLQVLVLSVDIFHFLAPFSINLVSAVFLITKIARQRSTVRHQITFRQHLKKQFFESKHLLVSPCVLVVLALPRLIISFVSGCMNSARDPWLFLAGYFVSFVPPLLTFVVFVLPSDTYTKEFCQRIMHRITP